VSVHVSKVFLLEVLFWVGNCYSMENIIGVGRELALLNATMQKSDI